MPTEKIIRSDTVRVFIVYADTMYVNINGVGGKVIYESEPGSSKTGSMLWQIGYRVKQIRDNGFSVIGVELLLDRNKRRFTDNYAIFDYRLLK